jgi:UDP:flavonoid glycosyltransferase YjiC (YdhE family)
VKKLRFDIEHLFIRVMPFQYRAVRAALAEQKPDVLLTEPAFTGAIALTLADDIARPPVVTAGVIPIALSSRDTAPFGIGMRPSSSFAGRLRNRALNSFVSRVVFRSAQQAAQRYGAELGLRPLPVFVLDAGQLVDRVLQLTVAGFEYPRRDLRVPVDFVGPVLPEGGAFTAPSWWADLDDGRPVVHVTQGTIANRDLAKIVEPAMKALAGKPLLVVVTTGNEETAAALRAGAPGNVRVEAFLPYDRLLPKVDVMITNGGYGGVHFALAHGVPLIVAGDTEEKPEIAARVAWAGAGVNLRTGSPSVEKLAGATQQVLEDSRYRRGAQRLRDEIAACRPLESIERALLATTGAGS